MSNISNRKKPGRGILPNLPDETMTPGRMRIGTDGSREFNRHSFDRNGTSPDFKAGLPVGNGDFGASIHGYPDNLTFNIAKNDLWWDDYESPVPCYPEYGIKGVREKARSGDETLKLDMYEASNRSCNKPIQTSAARLTLHLLSGAIVYNVKEHLDIAAGYAAQSFSCDDTNGIINGTNFNVVTSISRADNVMRIYCDAPTDVGRLGHIRFELTRDPMEVSANIGELTKEEISRREAEIDRFYSPECFVDGEFFGFNMRLKAGENPESSPDIHYTVLACTSESRIKYTNTGYSILADGRADKGLGIYLTVVSVYDADDTVTEAKNRLQKCLARNPYHVYQNANAEYSHNCKRSWIRLPEQRMEKPWYWGIYTAYSARRPGKFAPGYIAPWFASCYGNWGYHILTYEQTKSNLGLLATNHAELLECWFSLCLNAKEKLERFTKGFYNMHGVCYPHAISGTGNVIASSVSLNGTMMNIQTAGETVKYAWDYYDFTGDTEFLEKIGYPLLKDVALFYSDYLQTDGNGTKYIFPSRYLEYVAPAGFSDEFMTNTIIDLTLFKFILTRAATAAEILGKDKELSEKWRDDVAHMRKNYPTWPDGTLKLCEDYIDRTINNGYQGISELTPVTLTDEVDKWRGDEEMQKVMEKSINAYIPNNRLPWDLSFGIIARLRFGDKKYARLVLDMLPKCHEGGNLNRGDACDFDEKNEMRPDGQHSFFVDKGSAYLSEVITEMLLQSQGSIIRVFPAYPEDLGDAAFYSLRARGAFLVSAEMRDQKVAYAIIRSLKGNKCTAANPFGEELRVRDLETNEEVEYQPQSGNIVFDTVCEHEYVLENRNAPLESFEYMS